MSPKNKLSQLRKNLFEADLQIANLLVERLRVCESIGSLKSKLEIPIIDEDRERDLLERVSEIAVEAGFRPQFFKTVFKLFIGESIKIQKRILNYSAKQSERFP